MVICVAKKVTKKRKFKWKVILRLVLLLFLAGMCYMYVQSLPTKHILIRGNDFVSDNEIITAIGYKNYPKLFEKTRKDLEDSIKSIDFVDTVKIKRDLLGGPSILYLSRCVKSCQKRARPPDALFWKLFSSLEIIRIALLDGQKVVLIALEVHVQQLPHLPHVAAQHGLGQLLVVLLHIGGDVHAQA